MSIVTDKKLVTDLEALSDLDLPLDEPFHLEVNHQGVKYEFLLRLASANQKLICLGSGAYNPRKYRPPVYNRHRWMDEFEESVLYYNDPTLYNDNIITLGWGIGKYNQWYLEVIARIIAILKDKMGIPNSNTLFFGSSGGGYTSIVLATMFKGSAALVNNPQIFIKKYREGHLKNMVNACFNGLDEDTIMEKYGYRFDATEIFSWKGHIPPITYLVNINSENDFRNQLLPLLEKLTTMDIFHGQLKIIAYPSTEGHSGVLDKAATLDLIKNYFQNKKDLRIEIMGLKKELLEKDKVIRNLQRKNTDLKRNPPNLKTDTELEGLLKEKEKRIIELQTVAGYTSYKTSNIYLRLKKRLQTIIRKLTNPYYNFHQYLPGVDLNKLTVIIPYRKTGDRDRENNLDITLRYLNKIQIPKVIISEHSDDSEKEDLSRKYQKLFPSLEFIHTPAEGREFNRSLARNQGVIHSQTPYIATSDLDCLTPQRNIKIALGLLERGYDVVHPFNHRVTELVDKDAFVGDFNLYKVKAVEQIRNRADGGIIFWKKKSFITIGMENEYFQGWGGEDNEIMQRARLCGLKHHRIDDTLYHLYHHRPQNRTKINTELEKKTRGLQSKKECQEMIENWPWVKEARKKQV